MRKSASGSRGDAGGSTTRGDAARDVDRYEDRRHGRLFRLTASGLATTVVAGMLSVVAVAAALLIPRSPGAGADPDLAHHLEHAELAVVPGGSIAEY